MAADAIRVAGTMLFVHLGWSLAGIALAQLVAVAIEQLLFVLAIRSRYPRLRLRLADFKLETVRRLLTFSLPVMLVSIGGYLSFQTDPLVIGSVLSVDQIPFFLVSSRLMAVLLAFAQAMAAVVTPAATKIHTREEAGGLAALLLTWGRFSFCLAAVALVAMVLVGPHFVSWWIGPAYGPPSLLILGLLSPGYLLLIPAQCVAYPVLVATGRLGVASLGFLMAGLANVALSITLGRRFGLTGIALGTALPSALYGIFLHGLACRQAGLALREYFTYAMVAPGLRLALPVLLIGYAVDQSPTPFWLALIAGCAGALALLSLASAYPRAIGPHFAAARTGFAFPPSSTPSRPC